MAGGRLPGLLRASQNINIDDGTFQPVASPLPGLLRTHSAALLPVATSTSAAVVYNEDVHRDLTRVLAMCAGFDPDVARKIAYWNQQTDDDPAKSPLPNEQGFGAIRRRLWHFTTPERRRSLEEGFKSAPSVRKLGEFLHVYQDQYPHGELDPVTGQVGSSLGHHGKQRKRLGKPSTWESDSEKWDDADDTWRNIGMAVQMARETYNILQNAKKIMFEKKVLTNFDYAAVAWERISEDVWGFCRSSEAKEKDKYIEKIATVARENYRKQNDDNVTFIK